MPRMYSTYNQSGSAIVTQQLIKLKALGVVPRLQSYLTQIFRDEDGRVKGIEIREGYVFPKTGSGKLKTIKANKAVVLATGGFGEDVGFRKIQDPAARCNGHDNQPARRNSRGIESGHPRRLYALCNSPGFNLDPGAAPTRKGWALPPFLPRAAERSTDSGSTPRMAGVLSTSWQTGKSGLTPSCGKGTSAWHFAMPTASVPAKPCCPSSWKEGPSSSTIPLKPWQRPIMSHSVP